MMTTIAVRAAANRAAAMTTTITGRPGAAMAAGMATPKAIPRRRGKAGRNAAIRAVNPGRTATMTIVALPVPRMAAADTAVMAAGSAIPKVTAKLRAKAGATAEMLDDRRT